MSYLALARKWRPLRFNQVVGQSHVLTALDNALSQNKLHHAYLFSGTRGVGKTSIGRLFAKGLNCDTGITAMPCGECATCKEIDEGRFVDLLEIDAASRTKVEDTRELLDNVQYKPTRARFKVYLIDEVHMLSKHSFNALLKTLEEPPEYVKFLLATTDPQKLPVTILSRCLQFHLKPISVDHIHEQLRYILQQENVSAEQRALAMIAHAADGSMRDALSLTEQAIALGNNVVATNTVTMMLGTLDENQAVHLLEAIASKQVEAAMKAIQQLAQNGVDWSGLLQELAHQLHRIAMYQALPASLDKSKPDAERVEQISQYLSPQDVQLYYQIVLKGRQDLPLAPTERMGLEMIVLRMMAFRPTLVETASSIELPDKEPKELISPLQQIRERAVDQNQRLLETPINHEIANQEPKQEVNQELMEPKQGAVKPSSAVVTASKNSELASQSQRQAVYPVQSVSKEDSPATQGIAQNSLNIRHQLRSQRTRSQHAQAGTENSTTSNWPKKSKVVPPARASIEASQHAASKVPPISTHAIEDENSTVDEVYQWKSTAQQPVDETASELTPTQIKQALEHTKTPEMSEKLLSESVIQDPWTALIQKLTIPKLVEQLALNSSYNKQGLNIELCLRASYAHLNTDKAQKELLDALNLILEENCNLMVKIGNKGQTPLELREAIYQNKLKEAHKLLKDDKYVQFIQTRFAAELDADSVRPI